jgi:hypothetical protein
MQAETATTDPVQTPSPSALEELLSRRARLVEQLSETNERIRFVAKAIDPDDPEFTDALLAHFRRARQNALRAHSKE